MPALAIASTGSGVPDCCQSGLCPMHREMAEHDQTDCMGHHSPDGKAASMQACEAPAQHYVSMAPFVLAGPVNVFSPITTRLEAPSAMPGIVDPAKAPSPPPPRPLLA